MRPSRAGPLRNRGRVGATFRRGLSAAVAVAGGAALSLLLGITVAEVAARHLFGASILAAEDLAAMCLALFVAAGLVAAAGDGGHVSVDLIGRLAGRRVTRVTDLVARVLATGVTALAAFTLFSEGTCGVGCGEVTGTVGIVHTPFYYALGASMTAYSLLLASGPLPGRASTAPGGDGPATRGG
ncbi:MAG: TRAP transporter small permease subunit [Gammaproteobacteria bacterium]|nr:TRAP transporter small permease subunit [Gammaproteobacteria bacterium]MDE0248942.1 TRAP transporter small permease subunit [Gammaproteobacteria bacterium]